MDAPSIGFELPMVTLALGLVVLAIGLYLGGLTVVTVAGILIGFVGILGIVAAVVNTDEPGTVHG